jgi:hypothetical protein
MSEVQSCEVSLAQQWRNEVKVSSDKLNYIKLVSGTSNKLLGIKYYVREVGRLVHPRISYFSNRAIYLEVI